MAGWLRRLTTRRATRHAEPRGSSSIYHQLAELLSKEKNWAVTHLQNQQVSDDAEQEQLETRTHEWEERIARQLDGYADASDVASFVTLKTYHPKGLPPLVRGLQFSHDASLKSLAQRNAKFRNEVSEQLDRLEAIVKKIEQKAEVARTTESGRNRLDRLRTWFLDHKVAGPVIVAVIILGSVVIFTGNVAQNIRTIRSLMPGNTTLSAPVAGSTSNTLSCKVVVVNAVFDVGPRAQPQEPAELEIRFDGFRLAGKRPDTEPYAFVITDYGSGSYDMEVVTGLVLKFTGKVTLTESAFYIWDPKATVWQGGNETRPITLTPVSRREAGLLLARYGKELPACGDRRIGIGW